MSRKLREIAQDIANNLPGYSLAPYDPRHDANGEIAINEHCRLTRTENNITYVLWLNAISLNPGRICIGGDWPTMPNSRHPCYPENRPASITVSREKTPQQIAKDIQRRFLMAFEMAFEQGIKERDQRYNSEQKAKTVAKELAQELDTTTWNDYKFSGSVDKGKPYFDTTVHHGKNVEVTMNITNLTPELAKGIIQFVQKHHDPNQP